MVGLIACTLAGSAIAFAAARDGSGTSSGASKVAATPTSSRTAPTTTSTTRPRRGSGQPVTLVFGGDSHFEGVLGSKLASDPGGMFAPVAGTLGAADLAMVNLETAIATGGSPDSKAYNFRAPPSAYEALRAAGIDVVTMANNHGRDYGADGLAETLAAKQATPLRVVGIGANATEAYQPWIAEVKGQRIAIFGATDVLDDWLIQPWTATDAQPGLASTKDTALDRLLVGIRSVRPTVDTVVVYLHWGVEGATCPSARQQELARVLVESGVDVLVGSHAHRVMTAGRLGGALVGYGLGNFAFYNESGLSGVTGILRVVVTGRDVDAYEWLPARIRGGIPQLLTGDAAASDNAGFAARRACAALQA